MLTHAAQYSTIPPFQLPDIINSSNLDKPDNLDNFYNCPIPSETFSESPAQNFTCNPVDLICATGLFHFRTGIPIWNIGNFISQFKSRGVKKVS